MNDAHTPRKESFKKKMATIIGAGIVLIAAVYFGKKYKASQKKAEIAEFYNQFSDKTYIDFAKQLEAAIHENRPEEFDTHIDIASFFNFSNQELAGSFNKRKMIEFLKSSMKISEYISLHLDYAKEFIFTRFYKENGVPHIVFRKYRPDVINFIDFTLGIKKDKIIITDMYNYFSGVLFSEMASDLYYELMSEGNLSAINLKTYQQVKEYMEVGNFEEAHKRLMAIPDAERNPYHYQLLLINASNLDTDTLSAVIAEMKAFKPDDERLHTYLNFLKKLISGDIQKLNTAIDALKTYVGEDAIFNFYRGLLFDLQSDFEQAIAYYNKVIAAMPDFQDGYYYKLDVLLQQKKQQKALNLIAKIKARFSINEEDFTLMLQDFQEFTNSEAYKNIFKDAE